jgi:hypothetical protein
MAAQDLGRLRLLLNTPAVFLAVRARRSVRDTAGSTTRRLGVMTPYGSRLPDTCHQPLRSRQARSERADT